MTDHSRSRSQLVNREDVIFLITHQRSALLEAAERDGMKPHHAEVLRDMASWWGDLAEAVKKLSDRSVTRSETRERTELLGEGASDGGARSPGVARAKYESGERTEPSPNGSTDKPSEAVQPCPFCGVVPPVSPDASAWVVECNNRDCIPTVRACDWKREDAIAAWNRRVTPSHGGERSGCPCTVEGIEPCSYACSCAHPFMSGGCQRCAAYGSLEQRQAAARRLISSATTRGPWPLDTLIGRALDDLYRAYGIDFPRTNSDLRRCFSVAEKYLAATESRNTR
jgi:hypothetical protein